MLKAKSAKAQPLRSPLINNVKTTKIRTEFPYGFLLKKKRKLIKIIFTKLLIRYYLDFFEITFKTANITTPKIVAIARVA